MRVAKSFYQASRDRGMVRVSVLNICLIVLAIVLIVYVAQRI